MVEDKIDQKEKWKILEALEKQLNKSFETEKSLVRLGDKVGIPWPSIATGLYAFDQKVTGIGGIPRGRIIEALGPESSGKTTFALHICAQEQKQGGIVVYIDAEHSLDVSYASALGVDVDNLVISQPNSGEEALDTAVALVESKAVSLIIIDSVSALVPRAELEGDMGEAHMGLQARLLGQAMRKLRGICSMNNVTVLFINQIREKIGIMFGSNETTSGGRALRFYASMRLDIRRVGGEDGKIMENGELVGHRLRIKAIKNKMGVPFKESVSELRYGKGFDLNSELIDYAFSKGIIHKSGGWYKFEGDSYRKEELPIEKLRKAIDVGEVGL
jgi:recombination protein RecA